MSDENEVDFFADSVVEVQNQDALKRITSLSNLLLSKKDELEALNEQVKSVAADINCLETVDLPLAMDSAGIESVTVNGRKISVGKYVHANIPEKHRDKAFEWLRNNGHGSLIKSQVVIFLPRGKDSELSKIEAFLKQHKVEMETKTAVPWNTLTAFCREQLSKGESLPMDLLGVYDGRKVKIS